MRSEELKNSQFLLDFLYEQDAKNFMKIMKDSEKLVGARKLDEYTTTTGIARV
jgi:hypothetical protein